MKNSTKSILLILAAGAAGVAFFTLAQAQFTATLPGGTLLAIAVSLAVIAIAAADYSRRLQLRTLRSRTLRPALPAGTTPRTTARKDRLAA